MRPRDVRVSLSDVLVAGSWVEQFVAGRTVEEYLADKLLSSAVERQMEILGEALSRVLKSDDVIAESLPEARRVIGFRNILAHDYDRVSNVLVWSLVTESLPGLMAKVRAIFEDMDDNSAVDERLGESSASLVEFLENLAQDETG